MTREGADLSEDERKYARELLRNRLLRLDHIRTMGIPQEYTLDPMRGNNNHLKGCTSIFKSKNLIVDSLDF